MSSSVHSPTIPPFQCQSAANRSSPVRSPTSSPCISNSPSDLHYIPTSPRSLSITRKHLSKTQTRRFTPFHVNSLTTHPFRQQSIKFYSTCPPSDNCQVRQNEQLLPGELPPPITVDDTGDTSLSNLSSHLTSTPSRGFYHYSSSLPSRPSVPFSSKRRCSSLPPALHQLENTRNECSMPPLLRAAPPIGHEGFMMSLTPHTQPCQDKQRPSKEPLSPITINDASNTSSSMDNTPSIPSSPPSSDLTLFPASPTSSSAILWGPSQTETSTSSSAYGNRAASTSDDPKGWRSYVFEDRVAQVIRRVTGDGVTEGDTTGNLVAMPARPPYPFSMLRPSSMTLWPLPTALQYSSSPHSPLLTPFLPKRRYPSLRPTFHRPTNTRNECLRTPPSRMAPTIERKGFVSLLTLNTTSPSTSHSTTQKRSSKAQIRHFTPSPVRPFSTPSLQRRLTEVCSTCPLSDTSQPCQDKQSLPGELPAPIAVDNMSNTSLSNRNTPPVFPSAPICDLYRHQPALCSPPPIHEVFLPSNCTSAARRFHNLTPAHISGTKESGNLKNKERVAGIDKQIMEEMAVVGEGEEVTKASEQPTTMPEATTPPPTALKPSLVTEASAKASSPSTASWYMSTTPYTFDSTTNLHLEPATSLPHPASLHRRSTPPILPQRRCSSLPPFHRLEDQLLRSQLDLPRVSKASRPTLITRALTKTVSVNGLAAHVDNTSAYKVIVFINGITAFIYGITIFINCKASYMFHWIRYVIRRGGDESSHELWGEHICFQELTNGWALRGIHRGIKWQQAIY